MLLQQGKVAVLFGQHLDHLVNALRKLFATVTVLMKTQHRLGSVDVRENDLHATRQTPESVALLKAVLRAVTGVCRDRVDVDVSHCVFCITFYINLQKSILLINLYLNLPKMKKKN